MQQIIFFAIILGKYFVQVTDLFRIVLIRHIKSNHRAGRGLTGKNFTELNFKLQLVLFADEVESFLVISGINL